MLRTVAIVAISACLTHNASASEPLLWDLTNHDAHIRIQSMLYQNGIATSSSTCQLTEAKVYRCSVEGIKGIDLFTESESKAHKPKFLSIIGKVGDDTLGPVTISAIRSIDPSFSAIEAANIVVSLTKGAGETLGIGQKTYSTKTEYQLVVSGSEIIIVASEKEAVGSQKPAVSSRKPAPAANDTLEEIKADCADKWTNDYAMQDFCRNRQIKAINSLAGLRDRDQNDLNLMRALGKCVSEWKSEHGHDWAMVKFCYERQYKAYKRLN